MPTILSETDIDPVKEQTQEMLTKAEEEEADRAFAPTPNPGDLSDGGFIGGVRLYPVQGGRKQTKGRAVARRAWTWNGTESLLPLAWNPEGTRHDSAMHYLLKRHCSCCNYSGFNGRQCPLCVRNSCVQCKASTDRSKIIPCFYLKKEDVPFPARFYGNINCFLSECPRRGGRGFLTEQDMRVHARSRHTIQYRAEIETLEATRRDDLDALRRQVAALMGGGAEPQARRRRKATKE